MQKDFTQCVVRLFQDMFGIWKTFDFQFFFVCHHGFNSCLRNDVDLISEGVRSHTNKARNKLLEAVAFESLSKYLRLSVTGVENVPRNGPLVFISNHSGFSGLDALLLRYLIYKRTKNVPKILLHRLWYFCNSTKNAAHKMGFIEAKYSNGINALKNGESILLFPEGAHGNFKPYSEKYKLQNFKTGFLRMAMDCDCPISPAIILGPEESHINLKKMDMTGFIKDTVLPIPLNVWPLPVKWRVHFLEPIVPPSTTKTSQDPEAVRAQVKQIQEQLQSSINEGLRERGHPFI
jgi:1-acyl-sn-glycerol-3-phosphate acyltransferase